MQLKPEDISKIIKSQIKNYDTKLESAETGTVITVGDGIARAYGLDKCMANELVEFSNGEFGMALNLEENSVALVILGSDEGIKEGDTVKRTGKVVFPPHNRRLETFDELVDQWKKYLDISNRIVNKVNNIQMDVWRKYNMPVVNSLLKPDCFKKGQHIGNCGSRYNACINFESCGTITFINSLASLKKNVYDDKKYTLEEMTDAMLHNFGFRTAYDTGVFSPDYRESTEEAAKYARIFADCVNAPKYGNADPYADQLLRDYHMYLLHYLPTLESFFGKPEYLCQISVSTHGPQGFITLATADGRLAGTTYSDGSVSAAAGTDKNGVYALFESATVYDHSQNQNAQMNLKLHPSAVQGVQGTRKLLELVRTYMRKGGFHVQFNVVSSDTLRDAQKEPDKYRDLMVRVAGFTQYWCKIGKPIQDEVIFRTEYDEA